MISWILSQLSSLGRKIKSARSSAYSWASTFASSAYNRAVSWASGSISSAQAYLLRQLGAGLNSLRSFINSTSAWLTRRIDSVRALTNTIGAAIQATITRLLDTRIGQVIRQVLAAGADARRRVDAVLRDLDQLRKRLDWKLANAENSAKIDRKNIAGNAEKIEVFSLSGLLEWFMWAKNMLTAFVRDPLGFIWAFLNVYLLEWLMWLLAYAIGTKKAMLPPMPSWGRGSPGGLIMPGKPPPLGASGLGAPLTHLYVSGWPFKPGHPGLDLGLTNGQPVYAMHDGECIISDWSNVGYGFYVTVKNSEWWTLYAHLQTPTVASGQRVQRGQMVGHGDSTGNSTGPHLHLEIKHRGTYIDPVTVLDI